ncbi:MAG: dockerin type I repeat-containing protein, partial [Acutalibacteraceae bacterium]
YYGYKIEKTFSKYLHDYIDLSMDAPTAGMTPAEYAETIKIKNNDRFPYKNFEIGMVDCYRTDWVDFDTFAAGTTYFITVEIDLKDDTSFEFAHHDSDITALVNGSPLENYVVVDSDSTWKSSFNTYGGVQLSYQVYFTAQGEQTGTTAAPTTAAPTTAAPTTTAPTTTVKPTTTEPTTVITPFIYGDLNRDGKVNLMDLVALRKYLAKWSIEVDTAAADCNADSKVNLMDLILLRKYLAKWSVVLGPQK